MSDREQRIRQRAHQIWEEAGKPDGHADDHWRQAELEIEEARALTRQPRGTPTLPEAEVPGTRR